MDLQTLLDRLSEAGQIKPSRLRDIRSSVRRYALMLGSEDPRACPEEVYALDPRSRHELIESHLPDSSSHTLRNVKNNIGFILRQGQNLGLIRQIKERTGDPRARQFGRRTITNPLPALMSADGVAFHLDSYSLPLNRWPDKLRRQYDAWKRWVSSGDIASKGGDPKNRSATIENKTRKFEAFFGFLFHIKGIHDLDFEMLLDIEPAHSKPGGTKGVVQYREHPDTGLLEEYANWHESVRLGRPSVQAREIASIAGSVARRYFHPRAKAAGRYKEARLYDHLADEISAFRRTLERSKKVIPQKARAISRDDLLRAASAEFPNRKRLSPSQSGAEMASWAGRALALMLILHYPLRNRNYREARLSRNLVKKADGKWHLHFTGEDQDAGLKTEKRRGKPNIYDVPVAPEVALYLEEYLEHWRPILVRKVEQKLEHITSVEAAQQAKREEIENYRDYLFLHSRGGPFTRGGFAQWIQAGTYRWLGVRVNPDRLRQITAAAIMKETGDFLLVANLLNDDPRRVRRIYSQI